MNYQPVTFRQQEGSLVVSSDHLYFRYRYQEGGVESLEWLLLDLDKVSANAKGANGGKNKLRINLRGGDAANNFNKPLMFHFDNRTTLELAKEDVKYAIIRSRRELGEEDNFFNDVSEAWNDELGPSENDEPLGPAEHCRLTSRHDEPSNSIRRHGSTTHTTKTDNRSSRRHRTTSLSGGATTRASITTSRKRSVVAPLPPLSPISSKDEILLSASGGKEREQQEADVEMPASGAGSTTLNNNNNIKPTHFQRALQEEENFAKDRTESTVNTGPGASGGGGSGDDGSVGVVDARRMGETFNDNNHNNNSTDKLPQNRQELVALMNSLIDQRDLVSVMHNLIEQRAQQRGGDQQSRRDADLLGLDYADDEEEEEIVVGPSYNNNKNTKLMMMQDTSDSPFGDLDPHPAAAAAAAAALASENAENENEKLLKRVVDRNSITGGEDDDWHSPFPESTFTLLYMCSIESQGFWYATFVYLLQVCTMTLTMVDVMDIYKKDNPLRIPPMVDMTVTVAQAISLFMALAFQSDLIDAVIKIQDGYYPEVLTRHPGATYGTWVFSCAAQLASGLVLLAASFILTMQMETVIEGMMNLTALTFMAEIDDMGFAMAKMGFVRATLQREAESVIDFMVPKRESSNTSRRVCYLTALVSLLIGYGIIKNQQLNGHYLQTNLYVQFGDAYNQKIPYYSGILSSGEVRTANFREYRDLGTDNVLLSYCPSEKAWTFSDVDDPCDFFAISEETPSYDVTSLPDSAWHIKDSNGRLQPFESFSLVGRDCDSSTCQGTCNSDGLCQCPPDRVGIGCEFTKFCPELSIDMRFGKFPAATKTETQIFTYDDDVLLGDLGNYSMDPIEYLNTEKYAISDDFHVLKNDKGEYVRVYNMPVYYSNKTYPANIIFFGGRRWILTSELDLFNLALARLENPSQTSFPDRTVAVLENNFHAYHNANYTIFYLSDPVDFETPGFLPTPSGLKWWTVGVLNETARHFTPDSVVETVLHCKLCHADLNGYCGVGGTCNETSGQCECAYGYKGDLCELEEPCYDMANPCYRDGVCDDNSGVCRCNFPWYGKQCDVFYKCYEEYGSCMQAGQCNATTGFCECADDPAISGVACEYRKDCKIHGCKNGGLCGPNGQCLCRPPFHGLLCDLVNKTQTDFLCTKNEDCLNNGSCNATSGMCSCNSPFFGTFCEQEFNCSLTELSMNCANSGTCNSTSGQCECLEGYYGVDCSEYSKCTVDSDCAGDFPWCWDGECACDSGYSGAFCERMACKEEDGGGGGGCNGRGICNTQDVCVCEDPYHGPRCDLIRVLDDDEHCWSFDRFVADFELCGFPPFQQLEANTSDYEYCHDFVLSSWENKDGC